MGVSHVLARTAPGLRATVRFFGRRSRRYLL